jgi:hypothetical protein
MSRLEELLAAGSCAQCGAGVHMNDEGRIACNDCNLVTEECECAGEAKPDMSLPL